MSRIAFAKTSTRSFQLRKVESLDWKKIASLDIEKIIQDTDEDTLKEILPQIAFCQPDVEFDHNKTDPGFRKVFRLGQLIIEHLIQSQETALQKITAMDNNYTQVLLRSKSQEEEIKRLRIRLMDAKKELKRRKELIESNQLEKGGTKDAYDQCPYCDKKFIDSVYLYAHLQRRHQGLPPYRVPSQLHSASALVMNTQTPEPIHRSVASTQTENLDEEVAPDTFTTSVVDRHIVNDLVEEYLKQRVGSNSKGFLQNTDTLGRRSEGQWPLGERNASHEILSVGSPRQTTADMTEATIGVMKEALESQWRNIIEKMHKTELEELKSTLLEEMHKMQEIITKSTTQVVEPSKSPRAMSSPNVTSTSPSSVVLVGRVEDRIRKQENELEHLKTNLQTRIRADIGVIESRMESQERFWRAKLRTVENEYQEHIANLRQEFQASLQQNQQFQPQHHFAATRSPAKVKWPSDEAMMVVYKPPTPTTSMTETTAEVTDVPELSMTHPAPFRPIPKPRPRNLQVQTLPRTVTRKEEVPRVVNGLPPKVPSEFRPSTKSLPVSPIRHVETRTQIGQPIVQRLSDDSTSEDESTSVGTYSIVPQKVTKSPVTTTSGKVKDNVTMTSTDAHTDTEDLDRTKVRPFLESPKAQSPALQELSRQLQELGIRPESTELPRKAMKKSLKAMQKRRKSLNEQVEDFAADREILKEQANIMGNTKLLEGKLNKMNHSKQLAKPIQPPATTPLSKMFRAVKSGGNSLKRRMSSMAPGSRKPKIKVMSPRTRPKFNTTAGTPTPPNLKPASRKSAPPPPPPVTATTPPASVPSPKKKKPKLRTFFRRNILRKKKDSESGSDADPDTPKTIMLKRSRPAQFQSTPTPTHRYIAAKHLPSDKARQNVMPDVGPDVESHEMETRRFEIQRKAAKEIELGKQGVVTRGQIQSPIAGPSRNGYKEESNVVRVLQNHSSDSEDELFLPAKGNVHSSTAKHQDLLDYNPSGSSLNDEETTLYSSEDDASEVKSEPAIPINSPRNTPVHREEKSFAPAKPKTVETVIYHDPMAGLNEFGLKITPHKATLDNSDASSNTSGSSIIGGTKGLKRLQQRRDSKSSPNQNRRNRFSGATGTKKASPIFVPKGIKTQSTKPDDDTLNNPSDWETSIASGNEAAPTSPPRKKGGIKNGVAPLLEAKGANSPAKKSTILRTSSPANTKPPWTISGPKSKHKDDSWDST